METSGRAVAHVAGAGVAVVGADRPRRVGHAAGAGALLAGVVCRARVGIVAGSPVERVASAAKAGGAPVARRAGVVVLTDGAFLGCGIADADQLVALVAPEARAHVVRRTRVAVVARCPLGLGVAAAGGGEAPVAARAGVFVVADRAFLGSGIADTEALRAHVVRRARVAVVALCPVGLGVAAADAGDADVVRRAGIEIVAGCARREEGIAGALALLAGVVRCARVAVVARRAGEQVGHAGPILAHAVLGTRVQLVAQSAVPRTRVPDASSRDAGVVRRARVAVVAGPLHLHAAPAGPLLAAVVGGALAAVVARRAVVHGGVHEALGIGSRVGGVAGVADAGVEADVRARGVAREAEGVRARGGHHDQQSESAKCCVPLHGDRLTRATPMPEKARETERAAGRAAAQPRDTRGRASFDRRAA